MKKSGGSTKQSKSKSKSKSAKSSKNKAAAGVVLRAKVMVTTQAQNTPGTPQRELVSASAVTDGSQENKQFAQATPGLGLNMQIDNPSAIGLLKNGREYFLDFTPAD